MARRSQKNSHKRPQEPPASARSGKEASWRSIDPALRTSSLHGLLAAIFAVGLFVFTVKVDPIEALVLYLGMMALAVLLAGVGFRQGGGLFLRRFGSMQALAVYALAFWAFLRWKLAEFPSGIDAAERVAIPSAGRDGVIAFQFFAVAFALGLVFSAVPRLHVGTVWRSFRMVLGVSALGFALLGLYQYFFGYDSMLERFREEQSVAARLDPLMLQSIEHALQERRVGGTLGNGNIFAAWLSILGVACLSFLGGDQRPRLRLAGGLSFGLIVLAMVLTGSRGGFLTLAFATAGALLVIRRTGGFGRGNAASGSPGAPTAAASLLAALYLLAASSAQALDLGYRLTRITTIRERLNYWTVAMKIWAENLFIGGGPGAFELLYPQIKPLTARESRFAHSWIFHTGAELGLVGVALFLLFWAGVVWAFLRCWKTLPKAPAADGWESGNREALWLGLFTLVLGFNGLFEYSLQTPEFLALLGLCSGGLTGLAIRGDSTRDARAVPSSLIIRAGAAGLLLGVVAAAGLMAVPRSQLAANWEWRAEGASLAGDPFLAAGYASRAAKLLPGDEGPLLRWGGALMRMPGREEEAGRLLERAERLNPLSARIRSLRARFFAGEGRHDLALQKMNEAVDLYPADAGYRLQRAKLLRDLRRDEAAIQDLQFVEENAIPIWTYQRSEFDDLRVELGLPPTKATIEAREKAERRARKAREREAQEALETAGDG